MIALVLKAALTTGRDCCMPADAGLARLSKEDSRFTHLLARLFIIVFNRAFNKLSTSFIYIIIYHAIEGL